MMCGPMTNAPPKPEEKFVWGEGSDRVGVLDEKTPEEEAAELGVAKEWKAKEFDAGFGWISGPTRLGGRELTAEHERVYAGARNDYSIPNQTAFGIGMGMVGPTILAHAIPEVQERYLADLHRGDIVACQLFS